MRVADVISARLSLRKPQKESLDILDHLANLFEIKKDINVETTLKAVQAHYPQVLDFERNFPSLCFALATGVGKTRLMGAFIGYLYLTGKSRHFFILAPNLTIYDKLISDFSPKSPKYVFRGIAEFVNNPPVLITGENYESGRGVRQQFAGTGTVVQGALFESIHVNIFNISKINSEVRGGSAPRMKRLQEYIGQSYFEYLSQLDDLVLIMDEAHRYRATAGARAINELHPILGLELTATPQIETSASTVPFKNVIFQYSLAKALDDGYIKDPAVATRKDFRPADYSDEQLEFIKLEDGIHNHETVKVQLEIFSRNSGRPVVKPFVLVIAQDTEHASTLRNFIESDTFFDGRYKGKVLEIHSNQKGEEKDENVQHLLSIERADEPAEIVIHVNKLKEGWDVTNLYTIVPLRAASSKTLVEQSIGRGLRLPYGERVGVTAVDRLTIVAHDKFQEIIDNANDPNSIIRKSVIIGVDVPMEKPIVLVVPSVIESALTGAGTSSGKPIFDTDQERQLATITLKVVKRYENLASSQLLKTREVREKIVQEVAEIYAPVQMLIEGVAKPNIASVVDTVTTMVAESTIDVPNIVLVPTSEVNYGFKDFTVTTSNIHLQPVNEEILFHYLRTNERESLARGIARATEPRLENYIVRALVDRDSVSYDDHAALLYKLSAQVVSHLKSYLKEEHQVLNVLLYHQKQLGDLVYSQMMEHYWESPTQYQASVNRGFSLLRPTSYQMLAGDQIHDFRQNVQNRQQIRSMLFGGFKRCAYSVQKFQSDQERIFAMHAEDCKNVIRWMKPAAGVFKIEYKRGHSYEPDFVVETEDRKYICEPKAENELDDIDVKDKARAAIEWCSHATDHSKSNNGKPWSYVLMPHTAIISNATFEGLVAGFTKK